MFITAATGPGHAGRRGTWARRSVPGSTHRGWSQNRQQDRVCVLTSLPLFVVQSGTPSTSERKLYGQVTVCTLQKHAHGLGNGGASRKSDRTCVPAASLLHVTSFPSSRPRIIGSVPLRVTFASQWTSCTGRVFLCGRTQGSQLLPHHTRTCLLPTCSALPALAPYCVPVPHPRGDATPSLRGLPSPMCTTEIPSSETPSSPSSPGYSPSCTLFSPSFLTPSQSGLGPQQRFCGGPQ